MTALGLASVSSANATTPPAPASAFVPVATNEVGEFLDAMSGSSDNDVWAVGNEANHDLGSVALHWDGTQWTSVPVGGDALSAVAARTSTDAWAVGFSRTNTNDPTTNVPAVEHWDGTQWTSIASPVAAGALEAVTQLGANDVWTVGGQTMPVPGPYFTSVSIAMHWSGAGWTALPPIAGVSFSGVSRDAAGGMWVVGNREDPSTGNSTAVIYRWDGSQWLVQPTPSAVNAPGSKLAGITTVADGQAWAVGSYPVGSSGNQSSLLLHWDGSTWTQSAAPDVRGSTFVELSAVSAVSPSDVWAAGGYAVSGSSGGHALVEHWDGARWSVVDAPQAGDMPNPKPQSDFLGIAALPDGTVWAAGWVPAAFVNVSPLIEVLHETTVSSVGFAPGAADAPVGSTVGWRFTGATHEVRDATAMKLFDSGARPAGGSFTFEPPGAGTYAVIDPTTGRTGTLAVSITESATSPAGGFYLQWGTAVLKTGTCQCGYDVQIKRPGFGLYVPFKYGTAFPDTVWSPTGKGTFQFIARYRQGVHYTGWSPPVTVTVA